MSTLDELKKVIAKVTRCSEDEISAETPLKDIKADSLHWVQIIVGMETALDIEIDIEKMKEMTKISDLIDHIDSIAR